MKKLFLCSLIRLGVLGVAMQVGENGIRYVTGKTTVEKRLRDLFIPFTKILEIEKKKTFFPVLSVRLSGGETFFFLLFHMRCFLALTNRQERNTKKIRRGNRFVFRPFALLSRCPSHCTDSLHRSNTEKIFKQR